MWGVLWSRPFLLCLFPLLATANVFVHCFLLHCFCLCCQLGLWWLSNTPYDAIYFQQYQNRVQDTRMFFCMYPSILLCYSICLMLKVLWVMCRMISIIHKTTEVKHSRVAWNNATMRYGKNNRRIRLYFVPTDLRGCWIHLKQDFSMGMALGS